MHRLLFALLLGGCAVVPPATAPADPAEVLPLNEATFRTMIVDQDTALFAHLAPDEFRILAPGRVVEGRSRAMAGIAAWDAADLAVSGEEVVFRGPVAVVTGRLDVDGVMRPVGRWGPLKFMRVFVWEEAAWRLLSRSLTPCLAPVAALGQC